MRNKKNHKKRAVNKNTAGKNAVNKTANKESSQKSKENRAIFAAGGALGLAVLVACAFFLPSLLFGLNDRYLWQDIVLESRDPVDLTLLSSSYEPSLYTRMYHFAEGLASGTEYYVSQQELEVTEDLYNQLPSMGERYREPIYILFSGRLLDEIFFEAATIETWKQYVIYSDNYTQGVNFIIWYLELAAPTGEKLKLLIDAEDMNLYGIQSEASVQLASWVKGDFTMYGYLSRANYELPDLWNVFSYYYEAISAQDIEEYYGQLESYGYVYTEAPNSAATESIASTRISISTDRNRLILEIPYGEQYLDFCMEHTPDSDDAYYYYPQMTMGIEAIYRLIPEFSESF